MKSHGLFQFQNYFKIMLTALLCLIGLTYITVLSNIYIDTEFDPSLIKEGYALMDFIELTENAHKYLPFYTIFLFAIPVFIFMFSSYRDLLKYIFSIIPFFLILADIGSMYLIRYLWNGFAYVLYIAGSLLAITFVALFALLLWDIWIKNQN